MSVQGSKSLAIVFTRPYSEAQVSYSDLQMRNSMTTFEMDRESLCRQNETDVRESQRSERIAMIENAANDLIDGGNPKKLDKDLICPVYKRLRAKKLEVLEGRPDYSTANRIDFLIKELYNRMQRDKSISECKHDVERIENRLNYAENNLKQCGPTYEQLKANFDAEKEQSVQKLEKKQAKEMRNLLKKFSDELPAKHRKFSCELLNIRQQEKAMRRTGMYLEAQQLHEEGDALEAFELELAKNRYENEKAAAIESLEQHHQKQHDILVGKWNAKWAVIQPLVETKEKQCKLVVEDINSRLNSKLNRSKLPPLSSSKSTDTSRSKTLHSTQRSTSSITSKHSRYESSKSTKR